MKNLKHHKKQVKQHRTRNKFNDYLAKELDLISARVRASSAQRWDALQADLHLQRCKIANRIEARPNYAKCVAAEEFIKRMKIFDDTITFEEALAVQ